MKHKRKKGELFLLRRGSMFYGFTSIFGDHVLLQTKYSNKACLFYKHEIEPAAAVLREKFKIETEICTPEEARDFERLVPEATLNI